MKTHILYISKGKKGFVTGFDDRLDLDYSLPLEPNFGREKKAVNYQSREAAQDVLITEILASPQYNPNQFQVVTT
jgi:hypothetical protein